MLLLVVLTQALLLGLANVGLENETDWDSTRLSSDVKEVKLSFQSSEALSSGVPQTQARALRSLASFHKAQDNAGQANPLNREALLKHDAYEFYTHLLMQIDRREPGRGYAAQAFLVSERSRASYLLDQLSMIQTKTRERIDPALLLQERQLAWRLDALTQENFCQCLPGEAVDRQVNELLNSYRGVQAKIRMQSPRYATLVSRDPLSVAMIQRRVLDADTLLLEYSLGEEESFLWAVTAHSFTAFVLPPRAQIERQARQAYELLRSSDRRMAGASAHLALEDLGRILLAPLSGQLAGKRLAIVADGALQYIPFAALPDPDHSGEPLIVRHEILKLPSALVLVAQRQALAGRQPAPKTVAVFADPVYTEDDARLPAALRHASSVTISALDIDISRDIGIRGFSRLPASGDEAESILRLVPRGARLSALGFDADRNLALSRDLSHYRIIHFATHAIMDDIHPELSGLVLSLLDREGQPRVGVLGLDDIYGLSLRADLVVLSACRTALGEEVRGEGLVGLTHAFLSAGAKQVVSGLWGANDRGTAELMGRFYRGILTEGLSPSAALQAAQVSMLHDPKWESPYYWAGMILQGDWRQDRPLAVRTPSFVAAGEAGP